MKLMTHVFFLLSAWLFIAASQATNNTREYALLTTHSGTIAVPVTSWKTFRDARVVKQNFDYSCGAASLATLLNGYYGQQITEIQLLQAMGKDYRASFADMERVLPQFGFKARGFAANWQQLTRLKIPVVVYVHYRRDEHFSVLRGISADTVWLADPSMGNRTFSRQQFLAMWQTRSDKTASDLAGKFLAILPANTKINKDELFFTRTLRRQSSSATQQLLFSPLLRQATN